MKTSTFGIAALFFLLLMFASESYAQTVAPPQPPVNNAANISRPSGELGIPEIDDYVTNCYSLYDQTNAIQSQLNTMQQQIIVKKLTDAEVSDFDTQLQGINGQLLSLRSQGLLLVQSGSDMRDNAIKDLKDKPIKIPSAVIRVKNATKAVNVSLKNINTMLTVTIVDINKRLHPKTAADTAKVQLAVSGKTKKTSINITGISFDQFNALYTGISSITGIKSSSKKFSSSGKSQIEVVHYGTTDGLLTAILSNCKNLLSEKNIGSTENGKIALVF